MKNIDLEQLYRNFQRDGVAKDDKDPVRNLSKRELQTLIAIAHGMRPQDAAERIGIKIKTFSTYRSRVLDKLKFQSNAELAILAFELKLVPSVLKTLKENQDDRNRVAPDTAGGSSG